MGLACFGEPSWPKCAWCGKSSGKAFLTEVGDVVERMVCCFVLVELGFLLCAARPPPPMCVAQLKLHTSNFWWCCGMKSNEITPDFKSIKSNSHLIRLEWLPLQPKTGSILPCNLE